MQGEALEIIARAMAMTRNDSEIGWEHYTLDAEEVVTALEARGMVIVPREPTEAMCQAYFNALDNTWPNQRDLAKQQGKGWLSMPAWIWAAMLSATDGEAK